MEVGKSNIFKVLDGTTQFIIPVYQRAYSWTAENCDQLWRDIVSMQKTIDPAILSDLLLILQSKLCQQAYQNS